MKKRQLFLITLILMLCSFAYAEDGFQDDRIKADVWSKIAFQLEKAGNYEQAKEYYQKAIDLDPNKYEAYTNLGLIYVREGEYEKAMKCHQKTIELLPDDWRGYYNLGVAYSNTGDKENALKQVAKLRELNEKDRADDLRRLIGSGEIADGEPRF